MTYVAADHDEILLGGTGLMDEAHPGILPSHARGDAFTVSLHFFVMAANRSSRFIAGPPGGCRAII